jgi:hypothetical protein
VKEVKRKLDEFVKSGQAEKLQKKLKERAQNEYVRPRILGRAEQDNPL